MAGAQLLDPDEPDPVTLENEWEVRFSFSPASMRGAPSPAGSAASACRRPRRCGTSPGISASAPSGVQLSRLLDAAVILQTYSRLVIDCNRDPKVPSSIPEISESTEIPGNRGLDEAERAARANAIFRPYHDAIAAALDRRAAANRASALVALHSFTPVFKGVARPWHVACCSTAIHGSHTLWRNCCAPKAT